MAEKNKISIFGFSMEVTPFWESTENQENISDEQIIKANISLSDEIQTLLIDYRNILIEEDIAGLLQFQSELMFFHPFGRFQAHFEYGLGDGWGLMDELRSDMKWVMKFADNDYIKQFRFIYATYHYYASGKKNRGEMVTMAYLSETIMPLTEFFKRINTYRKFPELKTADRKLKPTDFYPLPPGVIKWRVVPPSLRATNPGEIRIYTGQSIETILSFVETGIQQRPPNVPGRAHYGSGLYTSPQKSIAEPYAENWRGLVRSANVKIDDLIIYDLTSKTGQQTFRQYLDSISTKYDLWNLHQQNRWELFEYFINKVSPDTDIIWAPHENGTQVVFRSQKALSRLETAIRKEVSSEQ